MQLPDYIATTIDAKDKPEILTTPATMLHFPLSPEDLEHVRILEAKFDFEDKNASGIAAPQIGIHKQIIIFGTPDVPNFKKWRPELTQTMPKTIWINPDYQGIEEEGKYVGWEACFSVVDSVGQVSRYNKIHYTAFDIEGNKLSDTAEGYLARVIQHEIDHIKGKLFIDCAIPGSIITMDEYKAIRAAAMAS